MASIIIFIVIIAILWSLARVVRDWSEHRHDSHPSDIRNDEDY